MEIRTRGPNVGEEPQDRALGDAGHAGGRTYAIALYEGRKDANTVVYAQTVHIPIIL